MATCLRTSPLDALGSAVGAAAYVLVFVYRTCYTVDLQAVGRIALLKSQTGASAICFPA